MLHIALEYIVHLLNNNRFTAFFKLSVLFFVFIGYEQLTTLKEHAISEHAEIRKEIATEISKLREDELRYEILNNKNFHDKIIELQNKISSLDARQAHNQLSITTAFRLLNSLQIQYANIISDCKIAHYTCKSKSKLKNN
jgi:hypothetical protein